jgi:hypothetical protein
MRTRGDLLSFAIAFALRGARKLVRGLRQELTEEERYRSGKERPFISGRRFEPAIPNMV